MEKKLHNPVFAAKVSKPRLPKIVHREGLYKLIDQGREHPCLWITGIAGSGKTTLVSGYIDHRGLPCLWYQMDRGDFDIATFFHYMGLAVSQLTTNGMTSFPHFTNEYTSGIGVFSLRFFEELFSRLDRGCAIVLDDYHEVADESGLHEIIPRAIASIPQGINLFIISRKPPNQAFSRLEANRMITRIGWDKIRLREKDTEAIVRLHAKRQLPDRFIKHLHLVTNGWVAGVTLMMTNWMEQEAEEPRGVENQTPVGIFDYLATEVFNSFDAFTRDFLCKTALFPHMTPSMADELTGISHAGRIFSGLFRNNLFIEKRRQVRTFYRYHPLFREFLLIRLNELHIIPDLKKLKQKAALILREEGQTDAAISLFLESGALRDASALINNLAPSMLLQGRTHVLKEWIGCFPDKKLHQSPWLLYWLGVCYLTCKPCRGRSCFQKAFELFEKIEDRAGLCLAWAGIVESIFYGFDEFPKFEYWIEVLENLIEKDPAFPSEQIEARVVFGMFSVLLFRKPHHPKMKYWADRAEKMARKTSDSRAKTYAYSQLIFYHMMMGHHHKGLSVVEDMERLKNFYEKDPFIAINNYAVRACYYQNTQENEKCLITIREGLAYSSECGVHIMDPMFLGWGAWSAIAADDMDTASELIEELSLSSANLKAHEKSFYLFLKSQQAIYHNDFQLAAQHAGASAMILEKLCIPFNICMVHMSEFQAMLGLGKISRAKQHIEKALDIARQTGSAMLQFNALLLQAQMELSLGRENPALVSIRRAMTLGSEQHLRINIVLKTADLATCCARALDEGIEVRYVQDLINSRRLKPPEPESVSESWPWAIKIYTLGRFDLVIDAKPISFSGKPPWKTLALLKVLIATGDGPVSETRVQDILWPDMEGDRAHNIFSTTLFRLRKLLRDKRAITLSQGKIKLEPDICWVDSRYFEKLSDRAETDRKAGNANVQKVIHPIAKAMDLYKGDFLAGEDDPWVMPIRKRLHERFLKGIEEIVGHYKSFQQFELAAKYEDKKMKIEHETSVFSSGEHRAMK